MAIRMISLGPGTPSFPPTYLIQVGPTTLIPVALTGGQVAFNTANTEFGYDDTINSGPRRSMTTTGIMWSSGAINRPVRKVHY